MQKPNSDRSVYLVAGARTPFIKSMNEPGPFSASDLGVNAAKSVLTKVPCDLSAIEEVIVGCVGAAADEANIARIIALRLGCNPETPAWTVARNCASGLQALDAAFQSIQGGKNLVLAGGCEAMSRAPLLFNDKMTRWFSRLNSAKGTLAKLKTALMFRPGFMAPDIALLKGLTDATIGMNMGQTAEELAFRFEISRSEMDAFAAESHLKALQAQKEGFFDAFCVPTYSWTGKVFEVDNGIREDSTPERLAKLRAVFDKYGNITAGNSSQVSDGGCMMLLASKEAVEKHNLPVLAKFSAFEWAALDPAIMGLGPVHAMAPLLARHNLTFEDMATVEINEAFAAQVLACQKALNNPQYLKQHCGVTKSIGTLQNEQLNVHGGAIAMGHPVGASGARLALQAAQAVQSSDCQYAIASLCIGGGQGGAVLVEKGAEYAGI